MPHEFSNNGMMWPEIGPCPGLESSPNPGEIACRIQGNSYASAYMEINRTQLPFRRFAPRPHGRE